MPSLPPSDNPWRAIDASVDGLRMLGWGLVVICFFISLSFGLGARGFSGDARLFIAIAVSVIPGGALLLFARYVQRRRTWAAVAAACLVGVVALLVAWLCLLFILRALGVQDSGIIIAPLVVGGGILFSALVRLVYHLVRTIESIRQLGTVERGFEPITSPPPEKKDR